MKRKVKNTSLKKPMKLLKKTGNLDFHKNRYYHQPKAPVERIQSTFSGVITTKRKTDGIHMIGSAKRFTANNLINSLNYFLEFMNPVSWYL